MTFPEEIDKCRREVEDLVRRRQTLDERFADPEGPGSKFDRSVERFRKAADEARGSGSATTGSRLVAAWGKARDQLAAQLCLLEARHFMASAYHLAYSGDLIGAQNQLANAVQSLTQAREILSPQDEDVARIKAELGEKVRDIRRETERIIARLERGLAETERLLEEFDRAA